MFTNISFKIAGILMVFAFVVAFATRPFVAAAAYLRNAFNWYAKYRKPSMASIHANMPAANAAGVVYHMRAQDAARARKETQLMWAYGIATVAFIITLFSVSITSTFPTTKAMASGLDMSYSFTHPARFSHSNGVRGCAHIGMNWSSNQQFKGVAQNPHPGCVPPAPVKAIVIRHHDGDGAPSTSTVTPPVVCTADCTPVVVPPVVVPPVVVPPVTHNHPHCDNGAGNGDDCTPGHSSGSNQGQGQQTGDQTNQGEQGNGHTNGNGQNNDHGKGHGKGK